MAKVNSFGTALQYEDPNNAGTYITVAQAKDISGPERTTSDIEVTTHDSANAYREYLPGLKDGGNISFDLEFDPADSASQAELQTLMEDRTVLNWRLVFPNSDSSRFDFAGFINSFSAEAPVDGSLTASVGIKITGKPTLTAVPA